MSHGSMDPIPDDRIELMKREIDALQVQVTKDRGPWYRQVPLVVPLVVSVMALALALITTIIGEGRVARQEKHDARVELRGLVQRLTALPNPANAERRRSLRKRHGRRTVLPLDGDPYSGPMAKCRRGGKL